MKWKLFQFSVFTTFLLFNIIFDWGIEGIAAPVMGGMLAWYATGFTVWVYELFTVHAAQRTKRRVVGQLDSWRAERASLKAKLQIQQPSQRDSNRSPT